jgi:hypothetical protein
MIKLVLALLGALFICSVVDAKPVKAQTPVGLNCYQGPTNPQWAPCNATNPLAVSGTFSASGFTPNGNYATLTAAGTSGSVALPAGTTVLFQNTGTTAVSCTLGIGSATATANEIIIQAAGAAGLTVGANTFGACIDQTGSVSNTVVLAGGAGIATGGGGGGGGTCGTNCALEAGGNLASILTAATSAVPACGTPCNLIGGVENGANKYQLVAASSTATALTGGSGGAAGDYLSHCVAFPTTTSPGVVTIIDNVTSVYSFPGGGSSTSNLVPFAIPVGSLSSSGAWKITTGAGISVVCTGKFT